jgi:hypothetical protein
MDPRLNDHSKMTVAGLTVQGDLLQGQEIRDIESEYKIAMTDVR